jgi:hypothetical protein
LRIGLHSYIGPYCAVADTQASQFLCSFLETLLVAACYYYMGASPAESYGCSSANAGGATRYKYYFVFHEGKKICAVFQPE